MSFYKVFTSVLIVFLSSVSAMENELVLSDNDSTVSENDSCFNTLLAEIPPLEDIEEPFADFAYPLQTIDPKLLVRQQISPEIITQEFIEEHPQCGSYCEYCDRNFYNISRHMRTHTGEKPYHCSVCDHEDSQFANCQRHIRTHHWNRAAAHIINYSKGLPTKHFIPDLGKKYTCYDCEKFWFDKSRYMRHLSAIHEGVESKKS